MIKVLNTCNEKIKDLPLLKDLELQTGINLSDYRNNSAQNAVVFMLKNKDEKQWL